MDQYKNLTQARQDIYQAKQKAKEIKDTSIFEGIIQLDEYRIEGYRGGIVKVYELIDNSYIFIKKMHVPCKISNKGLYQACCLR